MKPRPPRPPDPADAARFRALLFSVYYHTEPARLERPEHRTSRYAPLPLEVAVDMLAREDAARLAQFRPRVVSRLLLQRNLPLVSRLVSPDEYEQLRLAQLPTMKRAFRQRRATTLAYDRREEDYFNTVHDVLNVDAAPRYVHKWLKIDEYLVATIGVRFTSFRPFPELCSMLSPGNWAGAFPNFFQASYAVQIDRNGTFQQQVPPPNPANPWRLFECVQWNWNFMTLSQGQNLLNIGPQHAMSTAFRFDYSLYKCVSTSLGLVELPGGLDVDRGPLSVSSNADGTSTVTIQKSVRFTTPIINAVAPIVLWMWMDHVVLDALG